MKHTDHTLDNPPASQPVDQPTLWKNFAPELKAELVLWSDVVPAGGHGSRLVRRGTSLRLVALEDGANFSLVLYAAADKLERYNMPDSLKAQHTAHYTRGHVLMSDMGRAMASITQDSLGWHDPLGSLLDAETLAARYPAQPYATHRNAMARAGKESLLVEIAKHGLAPHDLIAPVNFFSKVSVDAEGRFEFALGHARAGAMVELRFEMDVLIAYATAPHALDPTPIYAARRVGMAAWRSGPAPADDHCRSFRPENARAIHNSDQHYL
ncbi:MAG TPA: urea amidolyase associated protein UAAP1 [Ideonella sp.]|nr:urea amidolyase associated protein UAAP1 [Ideonella sp.]